MLLKNHLLVDIVVREQTNKRARLGNDTYVRGVCQWLVYAFKTLTFS
jgi:hypothetical protein